MKMIRVSLAAFLAIAVCATVPAFAQHDHERESERDEMRSIPESGAGVACTQRVGDQQE